MVSIYFLIFPSQGGSFKAVAAEPETQQKYINN